MGKELNAPAEASTAPFVHSARVATHVPYSIVAVEEGAACCNRSACKLAFHVELCVLVVAAIVFSFLGIYKEITYFLLLALVVIIFLFLMGAYFWIYGCWCGRNAEIVFVPVLERTVQSTPSIVVKMGASDENQQFAHRQQRLPVQTGYPLQHQQQQRQYGTDHPSDQSQAAIGYPAVHNAPNFLSHIAVDLNREHQTL